MLFWKKDRISFVLRNWCLFPAVILWVDEFVWKLFWSFIMKFINEAIYGHGTCRFSNCLNRLLHEALATARTIILTTEYLPTVWKVTPENHSIFNNRVKLCIVNLFECVKIIFVKYKFIRLLFPFCIKFCSSFSVENTAWHYVTQVNILLSRGFLLNLISLLHGKAHIFKLGGRIM